MLFAAHLLALVAATAADSCSVRVHVDRHVLRPAMDASLRPTLGWKLSPGCGAAKQTAFRVGLFPTAGDPWYSQLIHSNESDPVPFSLWMRGQSSDYRTLAPGTSYSVRVALTLGDGHGQMDWTEPVSFHTQLTPSQYASSPPMWVANASAQFVMLRRQLPRPTDGRETFLSVSARPSPDWRLPHGHNTSHLLCAYKLWVNGVPLGAGPGRIIGGAIPVDTYNLTELLRLGPAQVLHYAFLYLCVSRGPRPERGARVELRGLSGADVCCRHSSERAGDRELLPSRRRSGRPRGQRPIGGVGPR
jgi:hypothetical protein